MSVAWEPRNQHAIANVNAAVDRVMGEYVAPDDIRNLAWPIQLERRRQWERPRVMSALWRGVIIGLLCEAPFAALLVWWAMR